ncbi:hemolysin family protein [Blautia sp. HCP3S3_G3]|uniref:hemolysin family protein n=1 Tax=Blautia sp. HCP3S3_G3 TaxID=3438913 RepID=UPI003F88F6AF
MEDGSSLPLWGVLILLTLLGLNGIFYGFSAAVKNLSESEIQKQALDGNKKAILLKKLMEHPVQYVNAIPLIVTASGISIGAFLVPWITRFSRHYIDHASVFALVLFVCVLLLASFGILTFRRVGTYCPEKFAFRYVGMVNAIVSILYPLTLFITWIAKLTAVPFGVELNQKEDAVTEEEIISIVDEAHEQGVIEESEAEMIQNIIYFNETEAREVMTHRTNVVAFSQDILLKEMVEQMMEEGISRYPVYGEDLNDILGIVHYKDAMKFMTKNSWAKFKPLKELPGLIRQAAFIPETRGIGDLLQSMQSKKIHMAIVVDEYGQTEGIVSMEDIVEEIVGEIMDEYDDEEITIRTQIDNSVIIDGLAYLEDVEEELEVDFGDVEFETLNGYLTSVLGHIPTEKDLDREIVANGYRFKILSLGNKTIDRVRAEKINDKEPKGEEKCQDIQNSQT